MTHPFSAPGRSRALQAMASSHPDLLIIGGGITGAGLAREAALHGLSTALIEKEDFGYGTSGRSSKLIHGGIRYLLQGDLPVVRECARERKSLLAMAPHLIHPVPHVLPLYKGESRAAARLFLRFFEYLAGAPPGERHRVLTPAQVRAQAPALREPLAGGLVYDEYVTDDARLTMENAQSAALLGALVANHAMAVGLLGEHGRVAGARVLDRLSGESFDVRARAVVNATGPWVMETLRAGGAASPHTLVPSKGIHLVFRSGRLPLEGAVVLKSPSGRRGFAVRRGEYVYVGTTDEPHTGRLDRPTADMGAVREVLSLACSAFPSLFLTLADVVGSWAGLRPLIARPGRSTRETSRHDEVWVAPSGLITVAGGKLTTYRAMAARVLEHVAGARITARATAPAGGLRTLPVLPRGNLGALSFDAFAAGATERLLNRGVPGPAARRISRLYGNSLELLLRMGDEDLAWLAPLAPGLPVIRAEVRLAAAEEMALTLTDLLDRRLALAVFSEDHGLGVAEEASRIMGGLLGWDEAKRLAELDSYRAAALDYALPGE